MLCLFPLKDRGGCSDVCEQHPTLAARRHSGNLPPLSRATPDKLERLARTPGLPPRKIAAM